MQRVIVKASAGDMVVYAQASSRSPARSGQMGEEKARTAQHSRVREADLQLVAGRGVDEVVCLRVLQPSIQAVLSQPHCSRSTSGQSMLLVHLSKNRARDRQNCILHTRPTAPPCNYRIKTLAHRSKDASVTTQVQTKVEPCVVHVLTYCSHVCSHTLCRWDTSTETTEDEVRILTRRCCSTGAASSMHSQCVWWLIRAGCLHGMLLPLFQVCLCLNEGTPVRCVPDYRVSFGPRGVICGLSEKFHEVLIRC